MASRKSNTSYQESKILMDHTAVETDINFHRMAEQHDFDQVFKRQEKLKKDLAFWNSMAEGKLESITGCVNLFILLLMETLASRIYNGAGTNGLEVLGWICVSQVFLVYIVLFCVKFILVPSIEADLALNSTEGIRLYQTIDKKKKAIRTLELSQLELLQQTVTSKANLFVKCFPHTLPNSVLLQVRSVLNSRSQKAYQPNKSLDALRLRQKNAKWWQSFWQVFVVGKTFSVPGVFFLVLIITPLSIATQALTSKSTNNAQGWIAVGFLVGGFLFFAIIKLFLWDALNEKVEASKCEVLEEYHSIYLKHKSLNDLSLAQLQSLKSLLEKRAEDFRLCFPGESPNELLVQVKQLISAKLPNNGNNINEVELNKVIANQKAIQSLTAAWTSFFNQRLITTIINILKFLIVIALTFVSYYSGTEAEKKNAKIAVGSIGIVYLVLGYLFYLFLRAYYLDSLELRARRARSSPFTTFRLVYFGNKKLRDLQAHEIEDICEGFDQRADEFLKCFPSIDPQALERELHEVLKEKLEHHYETSDQAYDLLKKWSQAKAMLAFWSGYVDNPLMSSMYSVYVLLVLLLVTIGGLYEGALQILGWIGVATIAFLIVLMFALKVFVIEYMASNVKALHVAGYSQYSLVYTKAKYLSSLELHQLNKIESIIHSNPIQFRKCFPKANPGSVLDEIKLIITEKGNHQREVKIKLSSEQVKLQLLTLEASRCRSALAAWTSLIMDKIYVITQLAIVVHILWVQSIATSLYGRTVCGFLTVGSLAIIAFLILFFNCYYRGYLQDKICESEHEIKGLEKKDHSILSM